VLKPGGHVEQIEEGVYDGQVATVIAQLLM
jgi:hypothetical protein